MKIRYFTLCNLTNQNGWTIPRQPIKKFGPFQEILLTNQLSSKNPIDQSKREDHSKIKIYIFHVYSDEGTFPGVTPEMYRDQHHRIENFTLSKNM